MFYLRQETPLLPESAGTGLIRLLANDPSPYFLNTRAGTVQANRRAKLAPSTGGQVERLLVKEGDRVVAGQVLLELWRDDLEAQLALARSEVERATALAEQARLQAELAEREAKRAEALLQQEIGAGDVVDRAVSQAKAERARERVPA